MRYAVPFGLLVAVAVIAAVAFLAPVAKDAPPAAKPVSIQYLNAKQIRRQLAPAATRFSSDALFGPQASGLACSLHMSRRNRWVLVVCSE